MPSVDAGAALLRAILEEPHEDLHRLAYADRLEEQGDAARADFIRVQLELAKIGQLHPPADDEDREVIRRHKHFRRRERELLCHNFDRWHSLPKCPHGAVWDMANFDDDDLEPEARRRALFRRGFVESITLPCSEFVREGVARAIFSAHPVTAVRLSDKEPVVDFTEAGRCCWYLPIKDHPLTDSHWVPEQLAAFLDGGRVIEFGSILDRYRFYDDAEAAHAALSRACVAWGRRQAGLPPLGVS